MDRERRRTRVRPRSPSVQTPGEGERFEVGEGVSDRPSPASVPDYIGKMRLRIPPLAAAACAAALAAAPALATLPQGSEPPWPHISGISPSSGPPGTEVTITGSYFRPGATVLVGGVEARVVSENGGRIVAVLGPHRPGRVSVEVRNRDDRSAVRGWAFRYLPAGAGAAAPR